MTTISTGTPAADSALVRSRASRPTNPAPSPAEIECFDIDTLPGDSDVTSHDVWLNSNDAKSVATRCSTSVDSLMGRGIGFLHAMPLTTVQPYQAGLAVVAPWNLYHA